MLAVSLTVSISTLLPFKGQSQVDVVHAYSPSLLVTRKAQRKRRCAAAAVGRGLWQLSCTTQLVCRATAKSGCCELLRTQLAAPSRMLTAGVNTRALLRVPAVRQSEREGEALTKSSHQQQRISNAHTLRLGSEHAGRFQAVLDNSACNSAQREQHGDGASRHVPSRRKYRPWLRSDGSSCNRKHPDHKDLRCERCRGIAAIVQGRLCSRTAHSA